MKWNLQVHPLHLGAMFSRRRLGDKAAVACLAYGVALARLSLPRRRLGNKAVVACLNALKTLFRRTIVVATSL